jgi:hypothetical protein
MKMIVTCLAACALALALATLSDAVASPESDSLKVAKEVKLYIAKDHKKRSSDPKADFEKLHDICGKTNTWNKGCFFWKAKGGKDVYMFRVRPKGKTYGIPSMFR